LLAALSIIGVFGLPAGLREPKVATPTTLATGRDLGSAKAPVTMVVYSDFTCLDCGVFARDDLPAIIDSFVRAGRLRIVRRDYTARSPYSLLLAIGARCAERDGKFWPYHDLLFANQTGATTPASAQAQMTVIADLVGIDGARFLACIADKSVETAVRADTTAAIAAGVKGVPTFDLNGQRLTGLASLPSIVTTINRALAGGTSSTPAIRVAPSAVVVPPTTPVASPPR
jgi:protein-disulfide isomerase